MLAVKNQTPNGRVLGFMKCFMGCMCECVVAQSVQLFNSTECSLPGSSGHGDSPGKSTGMGCHALLQGIFLTQGLQPPFLYLLHCRQFLYILSHQGNPVTG